MFSFTPSKNIKKCWQSCFFKSTKMFLFTVYTHRSSNTFFIYFISMLYPLTKTVKIPWEKLSIRGFTGREADCRVFVIRRSQVLLLHASIASKATVKMGCGTTARTIRAGMKSVWKTRFYSLFYRNIFLVPRQTFNSSFLVLIFNFINLNFFMLISTKVCPIINYSVLY